MTIKLINRGTEGEVLLQGRLDSFSAPEAEPILTEVAGRFDRLILNMNELEYVSSAGLRIIKNLHMAMRKREGELILTNVGKMVMEVFEMTGFVSLLRIEESKNS